MFVACEKSTEKQTCIKIKKPTLHNNVLQELRGCKWDNTCHACFFLIAFVNVFGEIILEYSLKSSKKYFFKN